MATTWQTSANVAFLVAGQTSFGRLSAIMDIIKQGIMTGTCTALRDCSVKRMIMMETLTFIQVTTSFKAGDTLPSSTLLLIVSTW